MIKIKDGKIDASVLDDKGCLSESFMNKYNYISMKKDFEVIIETLTMNKMMHSMYEEILDYKVDDNLEFIIVCNDPRAIKTDTQLLTLERVYYDSNVDGCKELLHKFKTSWNKLNEVEKYIIKSLYFDEEIKTDEELIDEIITYKNKYMLYKKSSYIKMDSLLSLSDPLIKDELDKVLFDSINIYTISKIRDEEIKCNVITSKI